MPYTVLASVKELYARLSVSPSTPAPSDAQVTDIIANISAEIDVHLDSAGYTIPVTMPASFLTWLGLLNAEGAAAIALKSYAPESVVSTNGGPVIPAYAYYERKYQDALKAIDDRTILNQSAPMGSDVFARSYLTDNPDNDPTTDGTTDGQQPVFSMQKVF